MTIWWCLRLVRLRAIDLVIDFVDKGGMPGARNIALAALPFCICYVTIARFDFKRFVRVVGFYSGITVQRLASFSVGPFV